MKITRYKRVHKYLSFYKNNYSFRAPYQILIDGTFCQYALKYKVNITEQLPKYFGDEVRIFTTSCVINETQKIGYAVRGALAILKQFKVIKCGHDNQAIPATDCILSNLKSSNYFIATQDTKLESHVRSVAGVPLIYIKLNTIVLEKPTKLSIELGMKPKVDLDAEEIEKVKLLKEKELGNKDEKIKKRKKVKGPNPLSIKKKKKRNKIDLDFNDNKGKKRNRKRVKVKIAKHVKKILNEHNIKL